MSQFSWNGRPFENIGCYDATLWDPSDQGFQKYSSLTGALGEQDLGEQKNQGASVQSGPVYLADLEVYQGRDIAPTPSGTHRGYLNQPTLEAAGCIYRCNDCSCDHDYDSVNSYLWTVADLRGEVPHFRRVARTQVKRGTGTLTFKLAMVGFVRIKWSSSRALEEISDTAIKSKSTAGNFVCGKALGVNSGEIEC